MKCPHCGSSEVDDVSNGLCGDVYGCAKCFYIFRKNGSEAPQKETPAGDEEKLDYTQRPPRGGWF